MKTIDYFIELLIPEPTKGKIDDGDLWEPISKYSGVSVIFYCKILSSDSSNELRCRLYEQVKFCFPDKIFLMETSNPNWVSFIIDIDEAQLDNPDTEQIMEDLFVTCLNNTVSDSGVELVKVEPTKEAKPLP
jgi:hypothetical protein